MILHGDCIKQMKTLKADSVDAIVTDPPYGLEFMGKEWDGFGTPLGFQTWTEQWAREALRVLKPGGHLLAFGGTRMYHRLAAGIEDAGFQIRDTLMWLYGSGFPKGHNLKGDWEGWGTALKPAVEPIVLARKPLIGTVADNVLTHGTGALNIDASRIESGGESLHGGTPTGTNNTVLGSGLGISSGKSQALGGRWPANILLDRAAAALLDEQSGGASRFFYVAKASRSERNKGLEGFAERNKYKAGGVGGTGGLRGVEDALNARPMANIHPTVKPVQLMRYLIRMVTPKGGTVLDPFLGSGTTAVAAIEEGVQWIGCEREAEYLTIIKARVAATQPGFGLSLD